MRTFLLYDPKIYSFTLIKEEKSDGIIAKVKELLAPLEHISFNISNREGWTIIELMCEIENGKKGSVNVSTDQVHQRYDDLIKNRQIMLERIKPMMQSSIPNNFTLITTGSHNNIWLRTFSDMSFLYKEKGKNVRSELLQTNITHLNRILRRSGEVMINSIKHSKVDATLFVLGPKVGEKPTTFLQDLVMDTDLSDISKTTTYGESPISVSRSTPYSDQVPEDKRSYQQRQNYLIALMSLKSKLLDLFILQSEFLHNRSGMIKDVDKKGRDLKEQIFSLQNSINDHMKVYIKKPEKKKQKKEKDFLEKETFEMEKQLLTNASVKFSMLSEVEHEIMRMSSNLGELGIHVQDINRTLDLSLNDISLNNASYTYGELAVREIEKETKKLNTLMKELSHSRDILSSNIEVLRTFIDTRQREVSEDMSRLMNLLFLVFACIGLADALGNFVILVLDKGFLSGDPSVMEVVRYGALGMFLTLFPLLIAAIFLYWYFKNK